MPEEHYNIADNSDLRKYRTEIPNLVLDKLAGDKIALNLYVHIKRIAGPEGECWMSLRRLAKTVGASHEGVRKKLMLLMRGEFIEEVGKRKVFGGYVRVFVIRDVWLRNMQHFAGRKPLTPSLTPSDAEKGRQALAKLDRAGETADTSTDTGVKSKATKKKRIEEERYGASKDESLTRELADALNDQRSIAFYRKLTGLYSYAELKGALGNVLEDMRKGKEIRNPPAMFQWWLKRQSGKRW